MPRSMEAAENDVATDDIDRCTTTVDYAGTGDT